MRSSALGDESQAVRKAARVKSGTPRATSYAGTALKALAVFDVIAAADLPTSFKELMELCHLPRATLHRMLSALVESGLVQYDAASRTYWLGMRLLDLAGKIWERIDLSGAFAKEFDQLRTITGERVQTVALEGFQIVYLEERGVLDEARPYYTRGRRHPAYCTAAGKILLARLDPAELRRLVGANAMTAYTPRTITTLPALQLELALAHERHYAIDDEEIELGQRSVAAAILDHRDRAIAAIGLTGPAERLTVARCHAVAPELIAAARRITTALRQLGKPAAPRPTRSDRRTDSRVSCAFPGTSFIGDSPVWCERTKRLHWVDIVAPAIHTGDPASGSATSMLLPSLVGSIVLREGGGYLAALQAGLAFVTERGEITPITNPLSDRPQNRFNDGKCDSRGRFWVSSMSMQREPGRGSLYRLDPDGRLHVVETGISLCNGPDWNLADDRMYLVDNFRGRVLAYPFHSRTGTLGAASVIAEFPSDGPAPGGLAVDDEDHIWLPMWDGGEVLRLRPDGTIADRIPVPVLKPTGAAFGGAGLRTLYVTSSRIRMSATQLDVWPLSGSVFAIDARVRGRSTQRFAG